MDQMGSKLQKYLKERCKQEDKFKIKMAINHNQVRAVQVEGRKITKKEVTTKKYLTFDKSLISLNHN